MAVATANAEAAAAGIKVNLIVADTLVTAASSDLIASVKAAVKAVIANDHSAANPIRTEINPKRNRLVKASSGRINIKKTERRRESPFFLYRYVAPPGLTCFSGLCFTDM